jgi:hypothetical protein
MAYAVAQMAAGRTTPRGFVVPYESADEAALVGMHPNLSGAHAAAGGRASASGPGDASLRKIEPRTRRWCA